MREPLRVLLVGAGGRLGHLIVDCDVVVDVSVANAAEEIASACVEHRKPLVIGTTGHSAEQARAIESAAAAIPIVLAPNFSAGVNTLVWLACKASELLGEEFDVEIVEAHHRSKKDAPSGTAKRLAEVLCEQRGLSYDDDVRHGREGGSDERTAKQIGMHAIRAGEIVGEHTVIFAGPGERLELTHRASSRDPFAIGALRAARWIVDQPPKLYGMEHVLGLNNRA
jgi:4-hydroxy-tetrahydrodipicolinate reductase